MTARLHESDPAQIIREGSLILGVPLDPDAVTKLVRHLEFLNEWRGRAKLTSLNTMPQMAVLHVLDSLTVFKVLPLGGHLRVIDVGTGGGFPGIVMRITDNSMNLTLMDADAKKIVFLKHLIRHLALDGLCFLNARLERFVVESEFSPFDLVVARAFSSEPALLQPLSHLVSKNGLLIRMLGPSPVDNRFWLADFREEAVWEGTLPFSTRTRRVIRYVRS